MSEEFVGAMTGVRLDDVSPLLAPWTLGPFGQLMPPLSAQAAQLSVELANTAYLLDTAAWQAAGWRDVTIQMENHLQGETEAEPEAGGVRGKVVSFIQHHFGHREDGKPTKIGAMTGALRQFHHESDTGKVLVMIRPDGNGRFVVAIGFMGTNYAYDWIANLRMQIEDGMHQGFLQLTRQFEHNEAEINFPETAEELGLERLTLADILTEAQRADSRFTIWLVGHSQGGAVVQLYMHRKLRMDGVHPRNMVGYAFAAPRVATGLVDATPSAYPLYLIENSEDIVPRSGALMHFGMRLIYQADSGMRDACYSWLEEGMPAIYRELAKPFMAGMTDMPRILERVDSYLRVLEEMQMGDNVESMDWLPWLKTPAKHLASVADAGVDAMIKRVRHYGEEAYVNITGHPMSEERLAADRRAAQAFIHLVGVRPSASAMAQLMMAAHTIGCKPGAQYAVYPYITLFGMDRLCPAIWRSGVTPVEVRIDAPGSGSIHVRRAPKRVQNRAIRRPRGGVAPVRGDVKRVSR